MRPLLAAAVFVCLLFLLGGAGEAAGTIHRITGIDSHAVEVDGRAAQRIEITVKKAGLHYALSERYHADNQLLVELEDVALDEHLPHEIALDGAVLQRLVVIPRENHRAAQGMIFAVRMPIVCILSRGRDVRRTPSGS